MLDGVYNSEAVHVVSLWRVPSSLSQLGFLPLNAGAIIRICVGRSLLSTPNARWKGRGGEKADLAGNRALPNEL